MRLSADAAISDIAGTLLMVGAVVLAGGLLTIVVSGTLASEPTPSSGVALSPLAAGDTSVRLVLRNGESLPLDELAISLQRGADAPVDVPRATWATIDPLTLRAGDSLAFALTPAANAGETLRVRLLHGPSNSVVADSSARVPGAIEETLGAPTLAATLSPSTIVADASSAALLAVRVSHPAGSLAVASVSADLRNLTNASSTADYTLLLADSGIDGDASGGDGVWSGLVRAAVNTTPGVYNLTINATDLTGQQTGSTYALLSVSGNLTFLVSNATATINNFTGNFSGTCIGCTIMGGAASYEGTRIVAPTSQNVTRFTMSNWTWDRLDPNRLDGDAVVVRVIGNTYAWAAYFELDNVATGPSITGIQFRNANATTRYLPTNGVGVPLTGLDFSLLDPTAHGFTCNSGCATPVLYQNADIRAPAALLVAWMRDETNNFQTDELGIYAVDMVIE